MGFLKAKWKYWRKHRKRIFRENNHLSSSREQNNMIKEKTKPKNKRGKYNKTNEKKNAKKLNRIQ